MDAPPRTGSASDPPRCSYCGDVIGVYEPYIVSAADGVTDPARGHGPPSPTHGVDLYHEKCYRESRALT